MDKIIFALYLGNRGFFPEAPIAGAGSEMVAESEKLGYCALMMDEGETP